MKKVLYIFILIAVFAVVGITIVALNITKNEAGVTTNYPDSLNLIQEDGLGTAQGQFSKWTTSIKQNAKEDSVFDNWQEANNIKYTDYIRKITDQQSEKPANTVVPDTPQDTETTYEDYYQWGWAPKQQAPIYTEVLTKNSEGSAITTYGNSLGTKVKSFVAIVGDQPKIMSDFIAGRGQPNNNKSLLLMSSRYTDLGAVLTVLSSQGSAPDNIKKLGLNLANAYLEVGLATKILAQSETTNDSATVESIYIYHKSVDSFAIHFVAFSNMLVAYGAEFKLGEGGDIFMPPM